jgi:hypothetical protein
VCPRQVPSPFFKGGKGVGRIPDSLERHAELLGATEVAQQLGQEVSTSGEVQVDRPAGHPSAFGDGGHGERFETSLIDYRSRGRQKRLCRAPASGVLRMDDRARQRMPPSRNNFTVRVLELKYTPCEVSSWEES